MLFKKTEIISAMYGKVEFFPKKSSWGGEEDNVLSLEGHGPFGTITFNEIKGENYSLWKLDVLLKEDSTIIIQSSQQSSLGLTITLKNDMPFSVEGFPDGISRKHQYTLYYLPYVKCGYKLSKGEYEIFGIEFTINYFNKWIDSFPLLTQFLDRLRWGIATKITTDNPTITPPMMEIINDIHHCTYSGTQLRMYLEPKVLDLLRLSLEHATAFDSIEDTAFLREEDVKLLQQVREYLLNNFENPPSLKELAHMMGINEFKLKTGFKKLYGTTVFDFVTDLRMQKAKKLIIETRLSLKAIGKIVGYKTISGFSTEFKKKFGTRPSVIKRGLTS